MANAIFDHDHPKTIGITFTFPEFPAARKKIS